MDDKISALVRGAIFQDIMKIYKRSGESVSRGKNGADILKKDFGISDEDIIEQLEYHSEKDLKSADIDKSSLAYISYAADRIASNSDSERDEISEKSKNQDRPLDSIFNRLNTDETGVGKDSYNPEMTEGINYPDSDNKKYSSDFYKKVKEHLKKEFKAGEFGPEYDDSLIEKAETVMGYIPSETEREESKDISMYDHSKLSGAVASSINLYCKEKGIDDYRKYLFEGFSSFCEENAFLMFSFDISGIQDFIYTISSSMALKGLRARSFYLEIVCEHIVDELLDEIGLTRANLIYSGGGHAYLILPNTEKCMDTVEKFEKAIKDWFLENFKTSLYIAVGYAECSASDLQNRVKGSYRDIFKRISDMISDKKEHRYSIDELMELNNLDREIENEERECKVCNTTDNLLSDGTCETCSSLIKFSNSVHESDFFMVSEQPADDNYLELPFGRYLNAVEKKNIEKRIGGSDFLRLYSKNLSGAEYPNTKNLYVGDYRKSSSFEELANSSEGIKRLGVLRADVDNLGKSFVRGFEAKGSDKYVTLARTAAFSRKMSQFIKSHINEILESGKFELKCNENSEEGIERNITIVYSGGDDVFVVGAWDDIIGFAIDLYESFKKYTGEALHFSGGIGIYHHKFPIAAMAKETGKLEDSAKDYVSRDKKEKNAVTMFSPEFTFSWDELINRVIKEKYDLMVRFFGYIDEKGNSFIYKLLDLMLNMEDRINLARYAYTIGRLELPKTNNKEKDIQREEIYEEFRVKMYDWIQNKIDRKETILAMYIYVYLNRESE